MIDHRAEVMRPPMKTRFFNEADGWSFEGAKITDAATLATVRNILEYHGPVIIEHWFYRAGRAPNRVVFDSFEDFTTYLETQTSAGDAIDVWSFATVCTAQSRLAEGKCPDEKGRIPKRGAY